MDIVTGAITANSPVSDVNQPTHQDDLIEHIFTLAQTNQLGGLIVDIDGTLQTLPPGDHVLTAPMLAAPSMIKLARFMPTGPLTGRPHMIVETGLAGLLDQEFGFASTEAGARLVRGNQIIYERAIPNIQQVKARIGEIVATLPEAFIEEHTNCSIIVGLTKVSAIYHEEAFNKLGAILKEIDTPQIPLDAVTGTKTGINVHYNFVCKGVDKGVGTKEIYDLFQINKPTIVCGDDKADGLMFEVAKERGGFSIGVGSKAPQADIHFEHPGQMVQFIDDLALRFS